MKNLLRYTLYTILVIVLVAGGLLLWLRFEFERVQQDSDTLSTWDQVSVQTLDDDPQIQQPCLHYYPEKRAFFGFCTKRRGRAGVSDIFFSLDSLLAVRFARSLFGSPLEAFKAKGPRRSAKTR